MQNDKPPCNMVAKMELVTKEVAQQFLSSMPENQRNLRQNRVNSYCQDRIDSKWAITHQGIGIDTLGRMIDGQHRCEMVVKTGLPTWFLIVRNVPQEAIFHVDEQLNRSMKDSLLIANKGDWTNSQVAIARTIELFPDMFSKVTLGIGSSTRFSSKEYVYEMLVKHDDAIAFATANSQSKGMGRGVRTLIARAYYHVDHDRLLEFCKILADGMPVSKNAIEDSAAICYRNYLLKFVGHASQALEAERYRKGQSALNHFINRSSMTKVYGTDDDCFPLPS